MDCSKALELIDDYYDEILSEDLRIDIDKHLGECFNCRTTYNEMNNYFFQLRSFAQVLELPSSLQNEITEEFTTEKPIEEIKPKKKGFSFFKKS